MNVGDRTRTDSDSSNDAASAAATASEGTTVTESSPATFGKSSKEPMQRSGYRSCTATAIDGLVDGVDSSCHALVRDLHS
jgi:hypothetical protein